MFPSEAIARYRLYAAHCVETAQVLADRKHKIALLNTAQAWMVLPIRSRKPRARRMTSRIRSRMNHNEVSLPWITQNRTTWSPC
jgi:hypothetical protein